MSPRSRAITVFAALVIAIGAFLLLRPEDEDGGDSTQRSTQPADTTTAPEQTTPEQTTPEPEPKEPEVETLRVKDGKIVGGLAEIEAKKGDTVRFNVRSDADHEIHLHGYDVSKDVAAGGTARFEVEADQTGIFEIEIEDTGTQIAELKVEP